MTMPGFQLPPDMMLLARLEAPLLAAKGNCMPPVMVKAVRPCCGWLASKLKLDGGS